MTKDTAIKVCNNLTDNYIPIVDNVLKNHLGINVNMKCCISENRDGCYIYLKPKNNTDVNKKMRGNKLLRHLFESAELQISVWFNEKDLSFYFNVCIYYKHHNGGSNGHDLMSFSINSKTKKIVYSKYNPKI